MTIVMRASRRTAGEIASAAIIPLANCAVCVVCVGERQDGYPCDSGIAAEATGGQGAVRVRLGDGWSGRGLGPTKPGRRPLLAEHRGLDDDERRGSSGTCGMKPLAQDLPGR